MQKRATALMQKKLSAGTNGQAEAPTQAQPAAPTAPLPEAPVSIVRRIGDGEECYQCNQECWDFLYLPTLSLPAMA